MRFLLFPQLVNQSGRAGLPLTETLAGRRLTIKSMSNISNFSKNGQIFLKMIID